MERELSVSFLMALMASALGVLATYRMAIRFKILDIPNKRSSHIRPTPRGGGIGILFGVLITILFYRLNKNYVLPGWPFWIGLALVAGIGLLDDILGYVKPIIRIALQVGAALLIAISFGYFKYLPFPPPFDISLGSFGFVLTLLWFVAVMNFFNFMDGIDGIAGLQALITGATIAFATRGSQAWLGSVIAGASLGFLFFNWQPAKIFMGDVGSYSLSFLLASAPFISETKSSYSLTMLIGLSLWMFLADATFTIVRRLVTGERIWEAHRSHLYQRLVQTGLPHYRVTMLVGISSVVISALGVYAYTGHATLRWWATFFVAVALFLGEMMLTVHRERTKRA